MTGSPSSIRRPLGQQSSFDALSRTIEGLEARIEGLMSRHSGFAHSDAVAADDADEIYGDGGEIVRRQKLLERERINLQARLDARRQARPAPRDDRAAPVSETSLKEIADALVEIRGELRRDLGEGFARELQALRDEIRGLGAAAAAEPLPAALRSDLMRLADCIQHLSERAVPGDAVDLRSDFAGLRQMIEGLARESSVAALDERWQALGESFSQFDPAALRDAIGEMVERLELLQEAVRSLPRSEPAAELEEQLTIVATAVETLARQGRLDETLIEQRFGELAERLDEISRAIVSVGAKADRTPDDEILQRLETRVEGLSRQIDDLFDRDIAAELALRIEALTGQLDQLASAASVERLGERLDGLAAHLGRQDTDAIVEHLVELSSRIDALGEGTTSGMLADRLDQLARKLDAVAAATERVEAQAAERFDALAGRDVEGLAGQEAGAIEARLAEIVRHLEKAQSLAPEGDAALHALEAQIAHLAELMMRAPAGGEAAEALEPRLAAIEEHLSTNDEFVIEAARHAAEAVVEAYGRGSAVGGGVEAADLGVIAELAEDLRALEAASQRSEQRSARAFDAVHDTLLKIAERLERLDARRGATAPDEDDSDGEVEVAAPEAATAKAALEAGGRAPAVTPAEAAAGAVVFAMSADDRTEGETGVSRSGFLAGLSRRMRPQRDDPVTEDEAAAARADLGTAPSIDPSDTLDAVSANEPLEPGSGSPDISRIVQKVREAQRLETREKTSAEIEQAQFIAAARRAAQAAAAEAETLGSGKPGRKARGLVDILKQRRRPILIAVGAVLVVLMSWPLVSAWRSPRLPAVASRSLPHPAGQKASVAVSPAAKTETPAAAGAHPAAPLPQVKAIDPKEPAGATAGPAAQASKAATGADEPAKAGGGLPALPARTAEAAADQPAKASDTSATPPATAAAGGSSSNSVTASIAGSAAQPAESPATSDAKPAAAIDTAAMALPAVPAEIGPDSLRKAAGKGEPAALFEIGSRYNDGRGVDTDLSTAATWYRAAAEQRLAPAEYRLANFYEKGTGVDRDVAVAKAWYLKAAGQGNASAMHNLAVLYAMGTGEGGDFAAAAKWFRQAADHGVKDSQFNLAILYAQGNGVPRDLAQSYKWFAIAAADGDKDAAEKRDQVAEALKPGELAAMKTAVKAWKPLPLDPAANSVPVPPEWAGTDTKTSSIDMSKAVRNIQAILDNNGFDAGKPDGIMGAKTKSAIKAFQKSVGQQPTGEITDALIKELLALNAKHAGKDDKKS
ncbi:MAG: peptidoglycan-binding protein [Pararhizobium sp.]